MQQLMQRPHTQPTSTNKCTVFPQQHCDVSYPSAGRNHWAAFEKYIAFKTRQGKINTFHEFKNMFVLTQTDTAWNWFDSIIDTIPDMAVLKEKFMRSFIFWGLTLREQCKYW